MKKILTVVLIILSCQAIVFAQSKKDKGDLDEMVNKAFKLEEEGKFDDAIILLKKCVKLSDKSDYVYELAYAYYHKKDYDNALKLMETILNKKDSKDLYFQITGNIYDEKGNREKAREYYKKGLVKFPNSGPLYLESGVVDMRDEKYEKALGNFELGIANAPTFPSNYYWAAKIYDWTSEKVWSLTYGEIFINLERNTKRTREISALLYNVYKKSVTKTNDTSAGISMTKNMTVTLPKKSKDLKLPFEMTMEASYYPMLIAFMTSKKDSLNMDMMASGRNDFVNLWFEKKNAKNFPNILFDYMKEVQSKGHLEAYSHWLLLAGNEKEFDEWNKGHQQQFKDFITWFKENPLKVSDTHHFTRTQYNK